jgi:hypothetical protein
MRLSRLIFAAGLMLGLASPVPASDPDAASARLPAPTVGVIRVAVGDTARVARELDKAFNESGTGRRTRIILFAIPLTNYLFAVATQSDLFTIRVLLRPCCGR